MSGGASRRPDPIEVIPLTSRLPDQPCPPDSWPLAKSTPTLLPLGPRVEAIISPSPLLRYTYFSEANIPFPYSISTSSCNFRILLLPTRYDSYYTVLNLTVCRSRLTELNAKLTRLEQRVEFLEGRMSSHVPVGAVMPAVPAVSSGAAGVSAATGATAPQQQTNASEEPPAYSQQ